MVYAIARWNNWRGWWTWRTDAADHNRSMYGCRDRRIEAIQGYGNPFIADEPRDPDIP